MFSQSKIFGTIRTGLLVSSILLFSTLSLQAADPVDLAKQILEATGVQGGLIVHVGSGDGSLTAALRKNDRYLVQGFDCDATNVQTARKHILSLGLYGKVTVDRFEGHRLPLVENLVNLVVVEESSALDPSELMRVLCPHGVAYVERDGKWTKTVKPRPAEIDQWTHCLHDATNNPVAHDETVGPPRRLQWVGSPRWSRHHDNMSSVSAVVSSGGRVFTIFDEGENSSIFLPSNWKLIARDAFNGTILWKRPIARWHVRLWPLKSGPAQLARRLVAVDQTVFVTLDVDAPLTALDAATGETIHTYEGTKGTEEILHSDGTLFLVVQPEGVASTMHPDEKNYESLAAVRNHRRTWRWEREPRYIVATNAQTGKNLWRARTPVAQSTLAVDDKSVYCFDGEKIVCLDRKDGTSRWTSDPMTSRTLNHTGYMPNLVVYKDVVLFAGGDRKMTSLSAETGKTLWTEEHLRGGHNSPEDLIIVGNLAWSAKIAGGGDSGVWTGRDLKTGEIKNEFSPDVDTYWFHHRCYRSKATDNYLLPSRTGIEFVDFNKQTWETHHWVRGACLYGIMPCNGLIYAPQHPCACYPEAKLNGFNALAPASPGPRIPKRLADAPRLERGPAFDQIDARPSTGPNDWPTYRHDAKRSGRTESALPTKLQAGWKTELGGRLSPIVVAGGKLFVASIDTHTVHALDATSGEKLWNYTTGGRIDSPPTIYRGLVLFGSADGYVYCLQATDGELVWRFRAAPIDERLVSFEQVESVWPVHGSVLVQDDVLFFVAGRNMFIDDGIWFYRLEPRTGKLISSTRMDDRIPDSDKSLQANVQVLNMPVAASDILSSDGEHVFMKSQSFDMTGKRESIGPHSGDPAGQGSVQRGEGPHVFCPSGFLDDTMWHRTYWVYGRSFAGGHAGYSQAGKFAPSGRLLVFDDEKVYGFGRKPQYYRWTTQIEHQLFSADKEAPELPSNFGRRRGITTARPARGGGRICVENSDSLDPTGKPLAVEAWVKTAKPNGVILARGGARVGYALVLKEGIPCFAVRISGQVTTVRAPDRISNEWVHLAGVLTAKRQLQIFVNGKLAGSGKSPGLLDEDPSNAMEIGEDASSAVGDYMVPFSFTGSIDQVRVYHGKVEPDEIARHYTEPDAVRTSVKDSRLVLSLSFDAENAKDASGRSNHGHVDGATFVEGKVGKAIACVAYPGSKIAPKVKKPNAKKKPGPKRQSGFFVQHHWTQDLPLIVRAMIQTGDTLFLVGPPDVIDEEEAALKLGSSEIRARLADQNAAMAGRKGSLLWAVSTSDGKKLSELQLKVSPVWDGMASADGCLYMTMTDGSVRCFTGRKPN